MSDRLCSKTGCGAPATRLPVLVMKVRGYEHVPIRAVYGLPVCAACTSDLTVDKFVTDAFWDRAVRGIMNAGKRPPDRELTTIDFIAIDSPEANEMVTATAHLPKPLLN